MVQCLTTPSKIRVLSLTCSVRKGSRRTWVWNLHYPKQVWDLITTTIRLKESRGSRVPIRTERSNTTRRIGQEGM
jgi:CxxC motif-containing protein